MDNLDVSIVAVLHAELKAQRAATTDALGRLTALECELAELRRLVVESNTHFARVLS